MKIGMIKVGRSESGRRCFSLIISYSRDEKSETLVVEVSCVLRLLKRRIRKKKKVENRMKTFTV